MYLLLRRSGGAVGIVIASACVVVAVPAHSAVARVPLAIPTQQVVDVRSFGMTAGALPVYVATAEGLFRSASPTLSSWTEQNTRTDITVVSPHPQRPDDLVYVTGSGTYRSTNGGRTGTLTDKCRFSDVVRSPSSPSTLYATSLAFAECAPHAPGNDPVATIARSSNDGVSWTTVVTAAANYQSDEGYGPIAVDPHDVSNVVVGLVEPHNDGALLATQDGGHTWHQQQNSPIRYTPVQALGFNPVESSDVWVAWANGGQGELDHNGVRVAAGSSSPISALAFDPLTGRLYVVSKSAATSRYQIEAADPGDTLFEPFAADLATVGSQIALTRNGYLLTGGSSPTGAQYEPLTVRKLIGTHNWRLAPQLASYYTHQGRQLLGGTLSPVTLCASVVCQYFDKGALQAQGHGVYSMVSLVLPLLAARAELPVGGTTSTVTYKTLYGLRQRVPPPKGFHHGTRAVAGGTFVPYSTQLAAVPGYVVPSFFWHYLTSRATTPHGWLQDVGLPVTRATPATVTKGRLGKRTIVVQAFQDAILTYDAQNATPWRVERANIGSDYAIVFPQAVR